MRLVLALLLLAASLLTACGGGSPGESPVSTSTPDETPVAVSGHFFSYVSDGSHIHAVDMSSGEVREVATLANPTEDLDYIQLEFRRGLLGDRTIEWRDLLFVDDGKLYLLPARSETATPPAPRQLSSMDTIDTTCGKQVSISADGKHEGLLFFVPDAGEDCASNLGSSYLITTDMGPDDTPVSHPAAWARDMAISHVSKGNYNITSFIGIRDDKLVRLNMNHQTSAVLKAGVASIDHSLRPTVSHPDLIFIRLTTTGGENSYHVLNLSSNTLTPDLGPAFNYPIFDEKKIYGIDSSLELLPAPSTLYVAGIDGSPARDIGCASIISGAYLMGKVGDLIIIGAGPARLSLNLKTCEQKSLFDQTNGSIAFIEGDQAYFDDPDAHSFHRLNIISMAESVTVQTQLKGVVFAPVKDGSSKPGNFILLSNLDKSDGDALRLESYGLQGEKQLLGALDSSIAEAEASFWNSNGHVIGLGTVSFKNTEEQPRAQLYSFKPDQAGSLTLLLEKDFLQKL